MRAYERRLLAASGGLLFGGFSGALLGGAIAVFSATAKGLVAGLGLGLMAAALVGNDAE